VEIRDELQLIDPLEIRDDIYREVSKKRKILDKVRFLGVIIWHRHISIFNQFCKVTCPYYLQYILSYQQTDYCFNDRLLHKINS
jgi:hypothetical protein